MRVNYFRDFINKSTPFLRESFEDTKGIIRIQRRTNNTMAKKKDTPNDLPNTAQKLLLSCL
jgi:hypothetical protein